MKVVTKDEFKQIKRKLITNRGYSGEKRVAKRYNRSIKTIIQIKNSKTFENYTEQNKAQHQPVKDSLAERVLALHEILFTSPDYIKPRTASNALDDLISTALEVTSEE